MCGPIWISSQNLLLHSDCASKIGEHCADRYGYLAGTDAARAADVNAMFADPGVQAIMAVRGGWGCNRILHLIDYAAVANHPKILVGYSDITSLLVGLYAKAGLVTFHGPVGTSTWNQFSVGYFKHVLMDGTADTFANPRSTGDNLDADPGPDTDDHAGEGARTAGGWQSVRSYRNAGFFLSSPSGNRSSSFSRTMASTSTVWTGCSRISGSPVSSAASPAS